jgi:hypothetical protein
VLFIPSLVVYIALLGLYHLMKQDKARVYLESRYFVAFLGIAAAFILGFCFFRLHDTIRWTLSYQPAAFSTARFQDRYFYYHYFNSTLMFPLNAFFLVGLIFTFIRWSKQAFYVLIQFVVPVAMASLLFSYKLSNYTFHVYPFFLMMAGYGAVQLYTICAVQIGKRLNAFPRATGRWAPWLRHGAAFLLLFSWLPATLWFRLGFKLPSYGAGEYNQVTTHRNWRWAADYVNAHRDAEDIVITSTVLTLKYYELESDFNLNNSVMPDAEAWENVDSMGRPRDVYSGVPSIIALEDLEGIIEANASGWLVLDVYRLGMAACVPRDIAAYIRMNLRQEAIDEAGTVLIYRWKRG